MAENELTPEQELAQLRERRRDHQRIINREQEALNRINKRIEELECEEMPTAVAT